MKNIKIFFILLCMIFSSAVVFAQQSAVEGKIKDENGEALIGAAVVVKETGKGSLTDIEGNFKLVLDPGSYTLEVSFVGFKKFTKKVTVGVGATVSFNCVLTTDVILEDVFVLGSRNQNRTVLESAVPVDIITLEDISKSAPQVELGDILNYIAPSFSSNKQTIADGTDHIDPASLRGLSVDHVLVLVNGKRRHTSSLVNVNGSVGRGSVGTDLNTIPTAAIKRIEVLRDGAAAQYGSDAIAGVINIVLKDNVEGINIISTLGQTKVGDGERTQLGINYGFKVGKKGFVNLTGQYQYRGRTDRAGEYTGSIYKTSWDGKEKSIYAENFVAGSLSPFMPGQRLTAQQATDINTRNSFTNNMTQQQEDSMINSNGGRRAFTMKVGQSEVVNTALMINSSFEIHEDAKVYLFGGMNSRQGKATGFFRLPNQTRTLTSIYPNGFLPEINSRIFDGSFGAGMKGKINGWNVDFSNTYGFNSFIFLITNTHNASRGTSSPTSFNAGGFSFSQNTVNLDFNRNFSNILDGMNVAFGAMYRVETYKIIAGEEGSYQNYGSFNVVDTSGGITFENKFRQENFFYGRPGGAQVFPGFKPNNALKQNRGNLGLYFDTEFQFSSSFYVDVALRFEDYTDFGSTFNWKMASRYDFSDRLGLRAAVSTGFRAPSLQQRYYNSVSTLFAIDPVTKLSVPNEVGTFSNESNVAKLFNIPSLTNESSLNISAGVTWNVLDNLNLTLDGYIVDIADRILMTGAFASSSSPEIADLLARANASKAAFFVNGVDTRTQGMDVILSHDADLGAGSLRTVLAANFTSTEVTKVNIPSSLRGDSEKFLGREEKARFETATPRNKINLAFSYSLKKLNANLNFVRFGKVTSKTGKESDQSTWIDQTFAAKVLTAFSLGYDLTKSINLTIGANNLFDVYPDENRSEYRSSERFVYSRRVSQSGFAGAFYFGRLNIKI